MRRGSGHRMQQEHRGRRGAARLIMAQAKRVRSDETLHAPQKVRKRVGVERDSGLPEGGSFRMSSRR